MFFNATICRQGDDCSNMTYWMNFTHPAYGNCFTFNTNGTSEAVKCEHIFTTYVSIKKVRQVTVTGSANGLVLEMFLDQVKSHGTDLIRLDIE